MGSSTPTPEAPDWTVVSGVTYVAARLVLEIKRRIRPAIDPLFTACRLALRFIIGAVNVAGKIQEEAGSLVGAGNSRSKVFLNRLPVGLDRLLATSRALQAIRKSANLV